MKKMNLLAIMALTTLTLAGCQNSSDREAALEDQVAQLEQQVTSLELENESLSENAPSEETSSEDSVSENLPDNTDSQNEESNQTSEDSIESLTKATDKIVKKANAVSPDSSNDDNQKKFFSLKGELQEVENRLERYEDLIEDKFHQDELSYEKAREAEIQIERLEDKLDEAEDRLENVFGYDD